MVENNMQEPDNAPQAHEVRPRHDLRPSTLIFLTVAAILIPFAATIGLAFGLRSLGISLDFLQSNIGSSLLAIISEFLYLLIIVWCFRNKLVT